MNEFIESLKRLYKENKVSDAKLDSLLKDKKITSEDLKKIKGGGK